MSGSGQKAPPPSIDEELFAPINGDDNNPFVTSIKGDIAASLETACKLFEETGPGDNQSLVNILQQAFGVMYADVQVDQAVNAVLADAGVLPKEVDEFKSFCMAVAQHPLVNSKASDNVTEAFARRKFAQFDEDDNKKLDPTELRKLLQSVLRETVPMTDVEWSERVTTLIHEHDENKDGVLQVDEFVSLFKAILSAEWVQTRMLGTRLLAASDKLFDVYDKNGDGVLQAREVQRMLTAEVRGAVAFTDVEWMERVSWIFEDFDANKDGVLDREEFKRLYASILSAPEVKAKFIEKMRQSQ